MSVQKIKSIEWERLDKNSGQGMITIELRDVFETYLLDTAYCDHVKIWWDSKAGNYDEAVRIYAIKNMSSNSDKKPIINKVNAWTKCDIIEALKWVEANLT